jgi:hypothetical protein
MATHKSTKTATAKAADETTNNSAFKMGETLFSVDGKPMSEAAWSAFMLNNAIKHPWLGLLAQIGTIAIGFSASIIIASTIANMVIGAGASMLILGIGLALYYFIGFIGCILSFRAASIVGDYVANGKIEEHYQDAKSWVMGFFSKDEAPAATVH